MVRILALLLFALPAALGCSSHYAYVPTTNANATIQGQIAADYEIPPQEPHGDVRIASYGISEVAPQDKPDEVMRAIHLRLVFANNGATPWTFDTRDQRLDVSARAVLAPAFASANPGTAPPEVTVDPNGKRVVDLFFLLPPDLQHANELPTFDALWRVGTTTGIVAERTPFERLLVEPDSADEYAAWDYGPDYYWGGPYWMNPAVSYPVYGGLYGRGVRIHRGAHFGGYHAFHGGGGFHGSVHGGFHGGGRR